MQKQQHDMLMHILGKRTQIAKIDWSKVSASAVAFGSASENKLIHPVRLVILMKNSR